MHKVIVGWVSQDFVHAKFCRSLIGLVMYPSGRYQILGVADQMGIYISDNRNLLVSDFLKVQEAEWLLQIDSDLSFRPNVLDMLFEHLESQRVISGWYFLLLKNKETGKREKVPSTFKFNPETKRYFPIEYIQERHCFPDAVGAGCLLVHRSVFEEFDASEEYPWFSHSSVGKKVYGEDVSFCQRVLEKGIRICVDPRVKLTHHKIMELE